MTKRSTLPYPIYRVQQAWRASPGNRDCMRSREARPPSETSIDARKHRNSRVTSHERLGARRSDARTSLCVTPVKAASNPPPLPLVEFRDRPATSTNFLRQRKQTWLRLQSLHPAYRVRLLPVCDPAAPSLFLKQLQNHRRRSASTSLAAQEAVVDTSTTTGRSTWWAGLAQEVLLSLR
jgi:hypothetical protein